MSDQSGEARPPAAVPPRLPNQDRLDTEIFYRDLNEVHLLIDFVSGRPDRNLGTLTFSDPLWKSPRAEQERQVASDQQQADASLQQAIAHQQQDAATRQQAAASQRRAAEFGQRADELDRQADEQQRLADEQQQKADAERQANPTQADEHQKQAEEHRSNVARLREQASAHRKEAEEQQNKSAEYQKKAEDHQKKAEEFQKTADELKKQVEADRQQLARLQVERRPELDSAASVERVMAIRFPPPDLPEDRAKEATTLLLAKDRLSGMAYPARGMTIAYTAMFVGARGQRFGGLWQAVKKTASDSAGSQILPPTAAGAQPVGDATVQQPSRVMLAERAFPELRSHAVLFRRLFIGLIYFTFFWLIVTALSYWDVALGNTILQRIETIEKEAATILQANSSLTGCLKGEDVPANASPNACLQLQRLADNAAQARQDLYKFSHCRGVIRWAFLRCWPGSTSVGRDVIPAAATTGPIAAVGPAVPSGSAAGPDRGAGAATATAATTAASGAPGGGDQQAPPKQPEQPPGSVGEPGKKEAAPPRPQPNGHAEGQGVAAILSVFASHIVPMMFGLLGTMIGAIRAIQRIIRDSELAPRDLTLTFMGLPMGAVAGLAVGLFLSPSATTVAGSAGLTGGLTLTAGALAFLAGYGAEAFFRFLDTLLDRVFSAAAPANRANPATVANPAAATPRG